ncbi:uncharacterized protein PITG_09784 [Phytophthora infestans T30-4]|uniref:Uncharacterized protein n=2 Tax=Phytophthora infestans TaxID=4787 RepID=D0NCT7_PHYIT|nr:uncharacterized protein PITG_09784 [Phytophthora infestans T30-4]EEY55801.1 conserved hypothetical protein [Phytophthora infestans T30-4]KAF4139675.1 hypothetical protein GN958_ATG11160 [Phytophthora infestans]KAI9984572.1 hypothetical protein PInf_005932 [Phytophthora infestans]|eukprot:XP_002903377.1 conserved hypothetical protein [Phytophthora infestans T30-4]
MKVEDGHEDASAMVSTSAGETALSEMNAAFASCLSLVCPPVQYPPHCRFNPVRDAADTAEIEARLEEFFLHAKQLEQLFLNDMADTLSSMRLESGADAEIMGGTQQQSELELEILNLEAELAEKNDLIEKYTDVVRGWEGKFKRLDHRMSPDRE